MSSANNTMRNIMVTVFDEDWSPKKCWDDNKGKIKGITGQIEVAPTTGKMHWQLYVELQNSMRLTGIKKMFGTAHIEQRKGTAVEAYAYVHKNETRFADTEDCQCHLPNKPYWDVLTTPAAAASGGNGVRRDLSDIHQMLKDGKDEKYIADASFALWCRYHKSIEKYRLMNSTPRKHVTELYVYYGEPGTGKSRRAFEEDDDAYYLRKGNGGAVWFDGYTGQKTVVIDDFYGWLPWDLVLRLADRYPLRVDVKGGSVEFVATKIIVTSNSAPEDWYDLKKGMDWAAMERRITLAEEYKKDGDKVVVVTTYKDGKKVAVVPRVRDDYGHILPYRLEEAAAAAAARRGAPPQGPVSGVITDADYETFGDWQEAEEIRLASQYSQYSYFGK